MAGESEQLPQPKSAGAATGASETSRLTRREALLQIAARRRHRGRRGRRRHLAQRAQPFGRCRICRAGAQRSSHRHRSAMAAPHRDAVCDGRTRSASRRAARAGPEGSRESGRHAPIRRAPGCRGHQAQHRLGSHARAGRQHQSRSRRRSGAPVLAGRRQARHRHRCELQRSAALLPSLRNSKPRHEPREQRSFCPTRRSSAKWKWAAWC